jgi:DNA-binding beta-propeller fold protein YncE
MAAVAAALAAIAATTLATSGHAQKDVTIRPNILLEIDPQTNHLVSSVPVGRDEAGLAATGDALWLASERDRTVSRVDLGTRTVKTIGEAEPVAFLTHDDRGNIYASGWDFPFVWQIDPRSVQIVRRFAVKTRALGLTVGGGSLWVVDRLANAVTRIDLAQQRVAQTISVGADPLAAAFGYGSLWVANSDSGTVSVIRPGATRPLVVDDIPRPFGISAGGGGIWVASNVGYVYRIDPDTHAVVARVNLGILSDYVYGIAAGPHGVWAISDHHLIRIDPRTNRIAARFRFPRDTEPKAVAFTPSSIWVSVGNPKDDM